MRSNSRALDDLFHDLVRPEVILVDDLQLRQGGSSPTMFVSVEVLSKGPVEPVVEVPLQLLWRRCPHQVPQPILVLQR